MYCWYCTSFFIRLSSLRIFISMLIDHRQSAKTTLRFRECYFPNYLPLWSNLWQTSSCLSACFTVGQEAAYGWILSLSFSLGEEKFARKRQRDPTLIKPRGSSPGRSCANFDPERGQRNRRFFRVHWPSVNAWVHGSAMRVRARVTLCIRICWISEKARLDVSWLLDLGDPIASRSTVASSSSTICRVFSRRSSTIDAANGDRSYKHKWLMTPKCIFKCQFKISRQRLTITYVHIHISQVF